MPQVARRVAIAVALVLTASARANAGALGVPCLHPLVFSGAAVNVLLLPYEYAGDTAKVTKTSAQLSALAQLDTLFSIVKYGSVAAIQLVTETRSEAPQCTAGIVARKLLGQEPGAERQLATGQSAVLVWGRFYEASGQTYVQSYVRFIARDAPVDAIDASIEDHRFTGRLSSSGFAFAPRLVSSAELDDIQHRAVEAIRVYEQPSATSRSMRMSGAGAQPLVYSVTKVQDGWMRIESHQGGVSGWVRGDTPMGEWSLRRKLPEFVFIEGIVGFLRARGAPAAPAAERRAAANVLERTLGEFNESKIRINSPAPLALAVGEQMLGILQFGPTATRDQLQAADRAFAHAAELVPYSADAVNLHMMSRLLLDMKSGPQVRHASSYVEAWTDALGRDPVNADAIDNLQTFLEWLEQDALSGSPTFTDAPGIEDIRQRLEATRNIKRARASAR
jgi:hypothetical protein